MNTPLTPRDDLHRLLCAMSDGTLSDEDAARLRDLLKNDSAVRDAYLDYVMMDAHLEFEFGGAIVPVSTAMSDSVTFDPELRNDDHARKRLRRSLSWAVPLAAGILIAVLAGRYVLHRPQAMAPALVLKSAGAVFAGSPGEAAPGTPVSTSEITLAKGVIELETNRHARVVIEAPATFQFRSSQRLLLHRGRVAAEVPADATGFTVATPTGEVIDIGTKFGVDVAAGGASEVHVFKGSVIARVSQTSDRHSLKQDQALSLKVGAAIPRDLRGAAFIQAEEIPQLAAGFRHGRQMHWVSSLAVLRRDPTLFALLNLDEASGGSFRRVQGRWPGSSGIEFTQPGDFLPLALSGTSDELTLAVWVRLDQVPDRINSLLHVDGWGHPGQVHWMVAENQRMRLAVYDARQVNPPTAQHYPESRKQVTAATGRWTHLAVVYDATRRIARFYLDGEFDNEVPLVASVPIVLGPARVGNWNHMDRMFSGRLDELVVLGRCLSDDEMQSLYRDGNPYGPVTDVSPKTALRW